MLKKIALIFAGLYCYTMAFAQLPQSNIYLFDLEVTDTSIDLSKPRFLTYFNEKGYNNQPHFFSEEEIYFTARMPYTTQTDLYKLDLENKTKTMVTSTTSGEYSAQRMPDYYSFSAVRQEVVGGDTLQRLWQFPIDRMSNGKPVFKYLNNIGYYHWLNSYEVVVFLVDNPTNYLAIADTRSDQVTNIASNPGRCFQRMSNGHLAFIQKSTFGDWLLMEKDYSRRRPAQKIIESLPGSEDFAILPDGTFLMGSGSKLYKYNRFTDEEWVEIADLSFYDISSITRLAISDDLKLAIVTD